jgi:hypothetical protein
MIFDSIKVKIKQNKIIYFFIQKARIFQYNFLYRINFAFNRELRRLLNKGKSKNNIKSFKNNYYGDRCFIIATGPSLTLEDLSLLKNEYTFGMNSLIKLFDTLNWETTFYGIQDLEVYSLLKDDIGKLKKSNVLAGSILDRVDNLPNSYIKYPLNMLNHFYSDYRKLGTKFSDDAYLEVFDGYTIAYSLLQIAVYMGFKEIYILGMDANYDENVSKRNIVDIGKIDHTYRNAGERIRFALNIAKKHLSNSEIEIVNVTRGGKLEIFPRKKLEDVLKN